MTEFAAVTDGIRAYGATAAVMASGVRQAAAGAAATGPGPLTPVFGLIGGDFLATLRNLATEGLLPPWSRWWDEGVIEALVPDEQRRREIEEELPRLPLSFYETSIEVPTNWCSADCGYLLLSEAYRPDASKATSLGWPVVERVGTHLHIVNEDEQIACCLIDLAGQR